MKKKLKTVVVIVILIVVISMVFGGDSENSGETKEVVGISEEGTASAEDSGQEDIVQADEGEQPAESGNGAGSVSIEEQVLLDQDGILITATEYVSDSIWGDGIRLLLENNSDRTVTVGCKALIVNHYMITDLFSSEVAAGKKANEVMYLSSSELKAAGIDTVGQVEVYFQIFDSESFDTILESDCVTIKTSGFEEMDTTPDDLGTELYQADGIRIVGKTVDEDSFWGTAMLLYCENTSGRNVGISVEEMSVNGFMMNPLFSTTVYDGKMSLDEITLLSSDLEANGIEAIEEVELKFHIYDADSYSTVADSEPISFAAQ